MRVPVKKYTVVGKSMEPSLVEGNRVIASHLAYAISRPRVGHIVIAKHPVSGIPLIKRVSRVQKERYFLEGDNARSSSDSRSFGWVTRDLILGKVLYVYS
ncbi:MAG: hypothetical protein RLZZ455_1204 [Candidatus Parcubacteria bacterium]|jgi:nickel-type superoxide dismutase maturation protease